MLKLLFFTTLLNTLLQSDQGQCENAEVQKQTCLNPMRDKDFSAVWVHENAPPKGWYNLIGNPTVRLRLAQLLQGKTLNAADDFTKLCFKSVHDTTDEAEIGGEWQGYGHLRASRKCSAAGGKFPCTATSNINPNYKDTFSGVPTYVDKRNFRSYHMGVVCYDNGDIGWMLSSMKRSLTDEDMETVKEQVKRIGFDPEDIVTLYDESCED